MDLTKRLIIAEIGMTHDGSLGQALEMTKAAAEAGVDAEKLEAETKKTQSSKTSQ